MAKQMATKYFAFIGIMKNASIVRLPKTIAYAIIRPKIAPDAPNPLMLVPAGRRATLNP